MSAIAKPLPHSLTPVATFKVDTGNNWCQRFACLPDSRGGVQLVVVTRRGFRTLGQWAFKNPISAQKWAEQQVRWNGPFEV